MAHPMQTEEQLMALLRTVGDLSIRYIGNAWVASLTTPAAVYEGQNARKDEALREVYRQLPEPE